MQFGLDRFLADATLRQPLAGRRVALLAHPASVTADLTPALDALAARDDIQLTAAFGPQHGLRGDKQDNMVESWDYHDPRLDIPVYSLYGEVRRPTPAMLDSFDVLLVDLQDLGCRIYTFITSLRYMLEAAAAYGKAVWVLDRPNPTGQPVEGMLLRAGWESFVGAAAMPMRHGLTMGEMARCYAGTVMLEGTALSEGRGTTRPLELFGAPAIDPLALLDSMQGMAPQWLAGCRLREFHFEPTFHKHVGALCTGVQIHVDDGAYDHGAFKPWRLQALAFKALRRLMPDYPLWRWCGRP